MFELYALSNRKIKYNLFGIQTKETIYRKPEKKSTNWLGNNSNSNLSQGIDILLY